MCAFVTNGKLILVLILLAIRQIQRTEKIPNRNENVDRVNQLCLHTTESIIRCNNVNLTDTKLLSFYLV